MLKNKKFNFEIKREMQKLKKNCDILIKNLHHLSKTWHETLVDIFARCWPISEIFSLADLADNLQQSSHHSYQVSLHNLVKN